MTPSSSISISRLAVVLLCLVGLSSSALAQRMRRVRCLPMQPPVGWFSGSTHDHIQPCNEPVPLTTQAMLRRLRRENLDVSSVLIWNPAGPGGGSPVLPFTEFVCNVTGLPVPSTGALVVQYGVELSGLDVSKWGHLIGLNIGPTEARVVIAQGMDDCYTDPVGLGVGCPGGDGTGHLVSLAAQHFDVAPNAVRGMAHQAWPVDLYSAVGYDWDTELIMSGFTTDAVALDVGQRLAFPRIFEENKLRYVYPAMVGSDVALGNIEFLETDDADFDYTFGDQGWPTALWYGAWYRLLNAGFRISPSGGEDTGCQPVGSQGLGLPRTWVQVNGSLSYDSWTEGLQSGRVSISMGDSHFLNLTVDGEEIGGQVEVASPANSVTVTATLYATCLESQVIEILRDGVVVASKRLRVPHTSNSKSFSTTVSISRSGWIAARLRSNLAHTGATYVILDTEPIANCMDAEYWMMWGDRVAQEVTSAPTAHFGCQDSEALDDLANSRKLFKSLRDYDFYDGGFDPSWAVIRYGRSTAACRGPINIGVSAEPTAGVPFEFTCLNAPPETTGILYISTTPIPDGVCASNVELWQDTGSLVTSIPATSLRNGAAITPVNATVLALPAATTLYCQYAWMNTTDCPGGGCDGLGAAFSASDALRVILE